MTTIKRSIKWNLTGLITILLSLSSPLHAQCFEESDECIATHSWHTSIALGAGAISNPMNGGSNIPLLVVPNIAYYGEQFYFENTEVGYTLSEGSHFSFSLMSALNPEAAYYYRWHPSNILAPSSYTSDVSVEAPSVPSSPDVELDEDLGIPITDSKTDLINSEECYITEQGEIIGDPNSAECIELGKLSSQSNGFSVGNSFSAELDDTAPSKLTINDVKKRSWAVDGGARLHLYTDYGLFQFKALSDISNVHRGYQLSFNYQQQLQLQDWSHAIALGGSYKSENLVNYYYGVSAQDHPDPRVHYQGKGSFNPFIRWFGSKNLSQEWQFIYWLGAQHLGKGISNSPLIKTATSYNAFIGFSYKVL